MQPYGDLVAAVTVLANGTYSGRKFGVASASSVPAASVYTIDLENDIDIQNASIIVTPLNVAASRTIGYVLVAHTADTTITVSTFSAADAAADRPFSVEVRRRGVRA